MSQAARDYLISHAIDLYVAAALGVTEEDGHLIYPYSDFERRRNLQTGITMQPKGQPLAPWVPMGTCHTMLLCEGEGDTMAAISSLYHVQDGILTAHKLPIYSEIRVMGIPGCSMPVDRIMEAMADCERVYLALDGDQAGQKASRRILTAMHRAGIFGIHVELPDGKDLSDCLAAAEDPLDWLLNILVDSEIAAEDTNHEMIVDDLKARLLS